MRKVWSLTVAAGLTAACLSAGAPGGIAAAAGTLPAKPAAVKLTVSPARPMKSEKFTVAGAMGTALACPVSLQYKAGKKWKAMATGTTDAVGAFSLTAATKSKKVTVRVFGGATTTCPQQVTRTSTVRTIGQTAKVSLPRKAAVGTPVTAKLAFTPARTGRPAQLQAKHGNAWTVVAQATQPNSGKTTISLTPDRAGTIAYRTVALPWNGASRAVSKTVKVKVKAAPAPPAITTATLPSGTLGTAYTATLTATGGTKPYSWTATGLPAGISVAKTTGKVTGTPTLAGTYHPSATVTDKAGRTATRAFTVTITGGATKDAVTQLSAGVMHTCAITRAGGVTCWGNNEAGQLGDGTTENRSSPVQVSGLTTGATSISAGFGFTCAVVNGAAKCWGSNGDGQLGDGTTTSRTVPAQVIGLTSGVKAVSVGDSHACALSTGGGVMCWGAAGYGQLGDGRGGHGEDHDYIISSTPVQVTGLSSSVTALDAGWLHSCALLAGGGVTCWGAGIWGEIGIEGYALTPTQVPGLSGGVTAISTEGRNTCVLERTGGVRCLGDNTTGDLGDGKGGDSGDEEHPNISSTPVQVQGLASGVSAVDTGCAITTTGTLKCWGDNRHGQLGDGTTANRLVPVPVPGLATGVVAVSRGDSHTCAIVKGTVECWGDNESGQLGDGTFTERHSPVAVKGLGQQ